VLLRIALYGGTVFIGVPLAFSYVMTKTYRSSSPAHAPHEYQELWLNSEGLRLRAWLAAKNGERPAVVVVHGLGDSLESYLEHARPFRERGHSVLLVDLRGHGGSEGSYTTLGGRERADVRAAMEELRRRGLVGHGIVLMGHSMGAVAVLLAAAEATDVRGVIVEAPYDTYRNSVVHHAKPTTRTQDRSASGWRPASTT
jgi:alpha-beta hydrolase superfamily lysophospholipase